MLLGGRKSENNIITARCTKDRRRKNVLGRYDTPERTKEVYNLAIAAVPVGLYVMPEKKIKVEGVKMKREIAFTETKAYSHIVEIEVESEDQLENILADIELSNLENQLSHEEIIEIIQKHGADGEIQEDFMPYESIDFD